MLYAKFGILEYISCGAFKGKDGREMYPCVEMNELFFLVTVSFLVTVHVSPIASPPALPARSAACRGAGVSRLRDFASLH